MAKDKKVEPSIEVSEGKVVITLPVEKPLQPSKSGKSLVIASTRGNMVTSSLVNNKPVWMGVNVYIKH